MIKIENSMTFGFTGAIAGMRNAYNSRKSSDSYHSGDLVEIVIGEKDLELAKKLINAGTDHRKFLRMIHVQADVTAPLYWWKEYDTYKVGTTANSSSTMHTICKKKFSMDDFSTDEAVHMKCWEYLLDELNYYREKYNKTGNKEYWRAIIQLLPNAYNQFRTIDLDYETLMRIYYARRNHKLSEWHKFCDWILELPYMSIFLN